MAAPPLGSSSEWLAVLDIEAVNAGPAPSLAIQVEQEDRIESPHGRCGPRMMLHAAHKRRASLKTLEGMMLHAAREGCF